MSSDKKNNVIKFPGSKVVSGPDSKGAGEANSASNKIISRVDPYFWATKGRLGGDKEKSSVEIKPTDSKSQPLSKPSSAHNVVNFSPSAPPPAEVPGKETNEDAQAKQPYYAVAGTAVALCFMVAGLVTLNQQNGPGGGGGRALATSGKSGAMPIITKADGSRHIAWFYEDANSRPAIMLKEQSTTARTPGSFSEESLVTKITEFLFGDTKKNIDSQNIKRKKDSDKDSSLSDEERLNLLLKNQEQKMLSLIKNGHRRLASIGVKPAVRDVFSLQVLKSRYDMRWKRGKLVYAVLLEDREPVYLPSTDQVVNEYEALFPSYAHIRKLNTVSNDLEIYELQDTDGSHTAEVETLRDTEGKLLSIHVVSD